MANGVWKVAFPWVFGHSGQLQLNKFFNRRKGRVGGNGGEKRGETFLVATKIVASRPPKRQPTGTLTAGANNNGGNSGY